MAEQEKQEPARKGHQPAGRPARKILFSLLVATAAVVALITGCLYAASPAAIRNPKMDHYHFRMQVVVAGQDVDFSQPAFQTPYEKGQCSAELSAQPIHFHDGKGQFVHVHWAGMTGGLVLKNYGWNRAGGVSGLLGYRLDGLPRIKAVPVHGNKLPELPPGVKVWVYTGDESAYQERSFGDFKKLDLEKFFGKESNFKSLARVPGGGVIDWLFPKAHGHGGEFHAGESDEEHLTRINNLLGNVVIFAQKDEPSDEEIRARFANLEPLTSTTCGS